MRKEIKGHGFFNEWFKIWYGGISFILALMFLVITFIKFQGGEMNIAIISFILTIIMLIIGVLSVKRKWL